MGDVNATQHGLPCAQPATTNSSRIIGNEDCLLVNVYAPQMPDGVTRLPVILWLHGGGYRYGSAAQYAPDALIDHRVVFVAVQYRLGSLGVLGTGTRDFPGNLALLDAAMAIDWVAEHMPHFGGDPDNIKLMGHGSGAVMAMHLSTAQMSRAKVAGVVAMSGSLLSRHSIEEQPEAAVMQVVELNECDGKSNDPKVMVNCMRDRRFQDVIRVDNRIAEERLQKRGIDSGLTGFVNILPNVEEKDDDRGLPGFLTESPMETIEQKHLPGIPLLIGMTQQETANGLNLKAIKKDFGSYENFLKGLSSTLNLGKLTGVLTKPLNSLPLQLPDVTKYLAVPNNLNPLGILSKLTEISTDLLFNLPSALVADVWSKSAPSFLYQFDYAGNNTAKGRDILPGLPLVSQGELDPSKEPPQIDVRSGGGTAPVAHGDELAYLFDLADVNGEPLKKGTVMSGQDEQVRKRFSKLIGDFAQFSGMNSTKSELFKSKFSSKGSSFIQINDKLNMKKDFRFCALSLWGASLESSSGQTDCKSSLLPGLPVNLPVALPPVIPTLFMSKPSGNKQGGGGFLGFL